MTRPVDNFARAAIGFMALSLAACSSSPPRTSAVSSDPSLRRIGNSIVVFQAETNFRDSAPVTPWRIIGGRDAARGFASVDLGSSVAIKIDAADGALLVRPVDLPLTTAPRLRWSWYLEPSHYAGGPGVGLDRGLRIEIGFSDRGPLQLFPGSGLPPHDRRFAVALAGVGAPRADLASQSLYAIADNGLRKQLTAHSGDVAGAWRIEEVDLVELHRAYFPSQKLDRATIEYIAVGGMPGALPPGAPPTVGYVAEILLTR